MKITFWKKRGKNYRKQKWQLYNIREQGKMLPFRHEKQPEKEVGLAKQEKEEETLLQNLKYFKKQKRWESTLQ